MRIIAGSARRRPVKVPKSVARPTTDRTREALFSMLSDVVKGATCLDLFAGSGALGLEALSRGASSCLFLDQDRRSVQVIKENLEELSLSGGSVKQCDATQLAFVGDASVDVVFADPPYTKKLGDVDFVEKLFAGDLRRLLKVQGYFVAEAPAGKVFPAPAGWSIVAERNYGSCGITVYQKDEK